MDNNVGKRRSQAIAISYDRVDNAAPKVVAKGSGPVADNIIAIAKENAVPIYKNKTLSGMLMAVELDREIPPELYQAVAEVLAHIYRLDSRLGQKGQSLLSGMESLR
jgi:flagellar biosynthesis protein